MISPLRISIACRFFFVALLFFLLCIRVSAQLSIGGVPFSFRISGDYNELKVFRPEIPDFSRLLEEDVENDRNGLPYHYAANLPLPVDLLKEGSWTSLVDGSKVCRLMVVSPGALALACYFDAFYLPEGASFFIYDQSNESLYGAFTSLNNQPDSLFATALVLSDRIVLEYNETAACNGKAVIRLSEISHAYRGVSFLDHRGTKGFGGSGPCEVNVNCPEGQNWQNQKRGVVRISVKTGSWSAWCTGSLLNNSRQDFKPWLLTADHCGAASTAQDLSQWVFYFNYESADCPDPSTEPVHKTLTGAVKKASSGGNGSAIRESDFYLVLLNNMVPDQYNPFFNGWSRQNTASQSGTCIHHPEGDIKKISTYVTPTLSSSWGSTPHSHWAVKWAATQSGHGVTEPGSSGSPLFNQQGLVMGQLSGGEASCTNLNGTDLYGKFSYSWAPAQSDSTTSLHHWLDPDQSNPISLPGNGPNITFVIADFSVDRDTVTVGSSLSFTDLSSGNPLSWAWNFSGGSPAFSSAQHPASVQYNKTGVFDVSLAVANSNTTDTLLRQRLITVIPNIYPNPHHDRIIIDLGDYPVEDFTAEVHDILGRRVKILVQEINPGTVYGVFIQNETSGMYHLRIKTSGLDLSKKVMFIKTP
ncbi:MAG TPA: PKD domain-containing protein [Bacteroidales bacterium]|nr:PKD domain-containing protein [Bacteroidales bacterium]HSA42878.1 PKD domain-containing protein [Bacteroidales bacterium]